MIRLCVRASRKIGQFTKVGACLEGMAVWLSNI